MRYRLRTLLIVLALGPSVLAGAWTIYAKVLPQRSADRFQRIIISPDESATLEFPLPE